MPRALTFRPFYALAALAVFGIEVAIALWAHDAWVRPYGGDVLAVVLVYLGLRAVSRVGVTSGATIAFAVGCLVEFGQWLDLTGQLGIAHDSILGIVLGSSFAWGDILSYAIGAAAVLLVERLRR